MPLVVRPARAADLAALDTIEVESVKRLPTRVAWLETVRGLMRRSLDVLPEGFLVADYEGRAIGAIIVRIADRHPLTGQRVGRIEWLTVSALWRNQGITEHLLSEASTFLKHAGCEVITYALQADAMVDADLFKAAGFRVAAWEVERPL